MHNIAEGTKVDAAVRPNIGGTSYVGEWFNMKEYAKALFVAEISRQTNAMSLTFDVYEATDAAGSDAQRLGAAITMAQGVKVTLAEVLAASVQVGDTLKIKPYTFDGQGLLTAGTELTFTAAAAENISAREFNQASTDAAAATSLAACINDATYGVPGVLASVSTATVTLSMDEPGDGAFDITELAAAVARLVVTDLVQQAHFEVAVQDLDRDDDFTHVGARFGSVDSTTVCGCTLIRALPGYSPVGQVSAYYDDAK